MRVYVPGTRGGRRVVLHGILSDGREEIHGPARGAKEVPVRPGDAAGGSLQAAGHLGLDGGPRPGRKGRCRAAHRPDGGAALQRPGREAHRTAEEVPTLLDVTS